MAYTAIEWAERVWNAIVGCTRVSEGCRHCYAEVMAWRHVLMCRALGRACKYEGTVHLVGGEPRWTGVLNFDEASLDLPLRTRKPATWFVNSMSDLFHEKVLEAWLDRMFAVMAQTPRHTYLILTKRDERMQAYTADTSRADDVGSVIFKAEKGALRNRSGAVRRAMASWPLPNVRLGASIENQDEAHRFDAVCALGEAGWKTMVSLEPLLGPLTIPDRYLRLGQRAWVIVGGESGLKSPRPMHPAWARSLRDQCVAAGVLFFFKQWGAWAPIPKLPGGIGRMVGAGDVVVTEDGRRASIKPDLSCDLEGQGVPMRCVGKKAAGRELDGRTWDEAPR